MPLEVHLEHFWVLVVVWVEAPVFVFRVDAWGGGGGRLGGRVGAWESLIGLGLSISNFFCVFVDFQVLLLLWVRFEHTLVFVVWWCVCYSSIMLA